MTGKRPNLPQSVIDIAMPIRDGLVQAGWIFGDIRRDSEDEAKVAFSATSPSGKSIFVACSKGDLAKKLQQLWDLS
jgi:hypothetical protein